MDDIFGIIVIAVPLLVIIPLTISILLTSAKINNYFRV